MKKNWSMVSVLGAMMLGGITSCKKDSEPGQPAPSPTATFKDMRAQPTGDWYGDSSTKTIDLEQGWTASQVEWFYTTTQGSHLMPYDFFLALEQADSEELFRSGHNMRKFRYLTNFKSPANPDDLPVGFVKDELFMGLTCAACHTSQVNYKGTGIRIQGAGSMADFGSFMNALIASLDATIKDPKKFDRFAVKVIGAKAPTESRLAGKDPSTNTEATKTALRDQLKEVHESLAFANKVNTDGVAPYGFARLDAFGRIYNRALTLVDKTNRNPSDAPVSYPFLWDTSQHDYVQWPGNAPNANLGELQRNIGEVIGVFGDITIDKDDVDRHGYKSSIDIKDLNELAMKLRLLQSPLWPESVLPALDKTLVQKGAALYAKECQSCHLPINRSDPNRVIRAQMFGLDIIKTDPTMATNAATYKGKTGVLQGKKELIIAGEVYGAEASAFNILTNLVAGVLENNIAGGLKAEIDALRGKEGRKPPPREGKYPNDPKDPTAQYLAYKARPLNGIWATAPFLHNGSVPTLWDLMLPVGNRPKTFYVGRYEIDPKKVGIVTDEFEGGFKFDTSVKGNSNSGHEYGTTLSEDDRWALVEYMKSL